MNETAYPGNIVSIRAIEHCIRSTKKYTEGVGTMRAKHPIQGEDFQSRSFCKYYEVYPEMDISWEMPVGTALDWLWGETPCIDVKFLYDYRINKATIIIKNGPLAVQQLAKSIPNFSDALAKVIANGQQQVIGVVK